MSKNVHIVLTMDENSNILQMQRGEIMTTTTNLNIKTDRMVKEKSERIFSELGLNMTTAVNMFLRASIRENGIPFELKMEKPNKATIGAIEEGRRIAADPAIQGYHTIEELKAALDV